MNAVILMKAFLEYSKKLEEKSDGEIDYAFLTKLAITVDKFMREKILIDDRSKL